MAQPEFVWRDPVLAGGVVGGDAGALGGGGAGFGEDEGGFGGGGAFDGGAFNCGDCSACTDERTACQCTDQECTVDETCVGCSENDCTGTGPDPDPCGGCSADECSGGGTGCQGDPCSYDATGPCAGCSDDYRTDPDPGPAGCVGCTGRMTYACFPPSQEPCEIGMVSPEPHGGGAGPFPIDGPPGAGGGEGIIDEPCGGGAGVSRLLEPPPGGGWCRGDFVSIGPEPCGGGDSGIFMVDPVLPPYDHGPEDVLDPCDLNPFSYRQGPERPPGDVGTCYDAGRTEWQPCDAGDFSIEEPPEGCDEFPSPTPCELWPITDLDHPKVPCEDAGLRTVEQCDERCLSFYDRTSEPEPACVCATCKLADTTHEVEAVYYFEGGAARRGGVPYARLQWSLRQRSPRQGTMRLRRQLRRRRLGEVLRSRARRTRAGF